MKIFLTLVTENGLCEEPDIKVDSTGNITTVITKDYKKRVQTTEVTFEVKPFNSSMLNNFRNNVNRRRK